MTFIPAFNTCKTVLTWQTAGVNALNIIWFRRPAGAFTAATLSDLNDVIIDNWWPLMRPRIATNTDLLTVSSTAWDTPEGEYATTPVGEAGTRTGGVLPANCAVVVSLLSDLVGRSRRGRIYIPGIPEEDVTENTVSSLIQAAFAAAANALVVQAQQLFVDWVIASFVTNGAPRAQAVLTPITQVRIDNRIDTQRRRLPNIWSN